MDTLQNLWNDLNAYMQSGFYQVNALQGLLIAIGAVAATAGLIWLWQRYIKR